STLDLRCYSEERGTPFASRCCCGATKNLSSPLLFRVAPCLRLCKRGDFDFGLNCRLSTYVVILRSAARLLRPAAVAGRRRISLRLCFTAPRDPQRLAVASSTRLR